MPEIKGKFITIEGGEGVGKSVFSSALRDHLESNGRKIVMSHEPGGTPLADAIRNLFKNPPENDDILPETELFLISAARAQHIGCKIVPAMEQGKWVLCDRFADSTRVYQGAMGGIPSDQLEKVILSSLKGLKPDLTFLLDCDPDIAIKRIEVRSSGGQNGSDRYDSASRDWHYRLRKAWLEIADRFPERIHILNANQPPHDVLRDAVKVLAEFGV